MKNIDKNDMNKAIDWCKSVMGPIEIISDHSKVHGGHESSTCRLQTSKGISYLKVHKSHSFWNNEVYAYENWASSFGDFAPELLAVRVENPPAIILSELPGKILENTMLSPSQEKAVWKSAGRALRKLHDLDKGTYFGQSLRDGTCAGDFIYKAREYISVKLDAQMEEAVRGKYINDEELKIIQAAYELIPAFEGERPVPCHRDYCPANWLIHEKGEWTGVIDFEFAHWDVRVSDFSRYPDWTWIEKPELIENFFEGYGRTLTDREKKQLLVSYAEYALSAIIWGRDNGFYGFEREGHEAFSRLASLLKY